MNQLLIIGSIAYDSIITPFGRADKALGGSATYFSLAASLFAPTMAIGVVGDDFKHLRVLKKRGIDTSGIDVKKGKTFHWTGKYHFDLNTRDTLKTSLGVFEHFKPRLNEPHRNCQYVFLGNIHPRLQLDVLKQIKRPKLVGLDTMNFWIEQARPDLLKVIKQIDLLVINDSEARELSKENNLVKAARKILAMMSRRSHGVGIPTKTSGGKFKNPTLIIKQGEHGLLMFHRNMIFNLPGYPLENVVDPTGAGDSFAGALMGFLAKTDVFTPTILKKACAMASTVASFTVEKFGVTKLSEIKVADVKKRLKNYQKLAKF
ncbi:MAG: PfkB family carbohydrate kinase [Candidatus Doudnabacteria bacterium]|nr:PfkB family carbohydrate kinase [Candidatus Doudnabacteria bacterium]